MRSRYHVRALTAASEAHDRRLAAGESREEAMAAAMLVYREEMEGRAAPKRPVPPIAISIIEDIANLYSVPASRIVGPGRHSDLVAARDAAAWQMRSDGMSYPLIGLALGGRDHSTVLLAVRRFEKRLAAEDVTAEGKRAA